MPGHGIGEFELDNYIGQCSSTSKLEILCGRGETLRSLRYVSDMEVVSRIFNCASFKKVFENGECTYFGLDESTEPGTIVILTRIFENVEVRRKTMRIHVELNKIIEFVQKMSILHHSISWSVFDAAEKKYVCQLMSQKSVALRFCSVHSTVILNKMTVRYQNITMNEIVAKESLIRLMSSRQ